jgi:hypothetical protein
MPAVANLADARRHARLGQLLRPLPVRPEWAPHPIPRALLDELHDLIDLCPAAAPERPARALFIATDAGKARLRPYVERVDAPAYVLLGFDTAFAGELACAFAERNADDMARVAQRNAELQDAYFTITARAFGLEVAPVTADLRALTAEFLGGSRMSASFLAAIGFPGP